MALTATANKMMVDDIMKRLKLRDCASFTQSFNRTNLNYIIFPKKRNLIEDIVKFINERHRNKTGVIYCLGRDKCESVAKQLRTKGLSAKHFHAGLEPSDKEKIQMEWQSGQCHIIVATVRTARTVAMVGVLTFFCSDCLRNGYRQGGRYVSSTFANEIAYRIK